MCGQGRWVGNRPMNDSGSWKQWEGETRSGQPVALAGWPVACATEGRAYPSQTLIGHVGVQHERSGETVPVVVPSRMR
jgi:hypothetical protein